MTTSRVIRRDKHNPLMSPIEKTREFVRRAIYQSFLKLTLKNARRYVKRFKKILSIEDSQKNFFLRKIEFHETRFAQTDYWEASIITPVKNLYATTSFLSFFVTPFLANLFLNRPIDNIYIFPSIILNMLFFYIFIWGIFTLSEFLSGAFRIALLFLPILVLVLLTSWLRIYNLQVLVFFATSLILCYIFFIAALMFYLVWKIFVENLSTGRVRRNYPDAYIIHIIIRMIRKLENKSYSWADIYFRKSLILDIERIGSCVERDLFRNFKSGDKVADYRLEIIAKRIATAFREKKNWVLTPKIDTHEYLIHNLSDSLIILIQGNWDALEQKEPEKISLKQTWIDFTKNTIKVIIGGGIPMLALFLIQNSSLALVTPIRDYAISGVVLWAIFTAITTFDPLFNNKISAIKEIVNLLPLINKNP